MDSNQTQRTFFITVHFAEDDPSWFGEFGRDFIGSFVKNRRQQVTESAPVGVEIDQNQFCIGQHSIEIVSIERKGPRIDVVEQPEKKLWIVSM